MKRRWLFASEGCRYTSRTSSHARLSTWSGLEKEAKPVRCAVELAGVAYRAALPAEQMVRRANSRMHTDRFVHLCGPVIRQRSSPREAGRCKAVAGQSARHPGGFTTEHCP